MTGRDQAEQLEGTAAVVAHRQALEAAGVMRTAEIQLKAPKFRGDPRLKKFPDSEAKTKEAVLDGIAATKRRYQLLSHRDLEQPEVYAFTADGENRAWHKSLKDHGSNEINVGAGGFGVQADKIDRATTHEWGHALEARNPKLLARATAYYEARTKGEALRHMGAGYEPHEMTKPDKLFDAYMGKNYVTYRGERRATELTSMGAEQLTRAVDWASLYKKDRDTAHFVLGQLANQ